MRQHTLNVSLTPALAGLIREKLDSGSYHSASEVVRDALRLLQEKDRKEQLRSEALMKMVGKNDVAASKLQSGIALFDSGMEIMEQNLRREFPEATEIELSSRMDKWLASDDLSDQVSTHLRNAPDRLRRLRGE